MTNPAKKCKACEKPMPQRGPQYCSTECRAQSYIGRRTRTTTECPCGTKFDKYYGGSRVYCSEFCLKRFDRRGVRDSERAREIGSHSKPNHGLKGYKQSPEHLLKRLGTGAIKASKEELSLVPVLSKLGYRHTGEGAFWRRWKDGSLHNSDFVNEETRTVVEYFGAYWHRDDRGREEEIIAAWADIGYTCVILWPEDRQTLLVAGGPV